MKIENILPMAIPVAFITFIVWELIRPARKLPKVPWWRLKGLLFFFMTSAIGGVLPFAWDGFVKSHSLLDLSGLGTLGGAVVGYFVFQFFNYWWHRLQHTSPFLWRWTHQMHHSAERVDIYGVGLFHPLDVMAMTVLSGMVFSFVLGLSPGATALAGTIGLFAAFLEHTNIRTPRWLGYLTQ